MNKIAGLFAALALLLYTAAPSFAGTKALDEGDLDRITAAGEPTIIQVSGVEIESSGEVNFEISYEDNSSDSVAIEGGTTDINGGQQNLRALVVNNIAGETLAANALNITGTVSGAGIGTPTSASKQTNEINQSWGAVKITDVVTATESISVEGEDADGGDGGDGGNSGGSSGGFCIGICGSRDDSGQGGDGGDGDTSPGSTAVAVVAYPIWMSADLIIHVQDVSITNTTEPTTGDNEPVDFAINVNKSAIASVAIEGAAQSDLAALVVNNAAGKVLLANAVNIAGGAIAVSSPLGINASAGGVLIEQTNTVNQYRGTPINAPQPIGVATVTPNGCGSVGNGQFSC
jgi:hypothetical protein